VAKGMQALSGSSSSASKVGIYYIPYILEDELSPLHRILNSEIILGLLFLVHIGIIILIGLHKLYVSSGLKFISKLLSPKNSTKYENIKKMIEKIGDIYLYLLVIINVILILFYICTIIYANVELSNNIDTYINVHLNMKKSVIMFWIVKSNLIVNNNNYKMDKFKYFNSSSILHTKIKINKEVFELENNKQKQTNKTMAKLFAELIKRHGFGIVMSAIAMDGYRRTVNNDNNSRILKAIEDKLEAARREGDKAAQAEYKKQIEFMNDKAHNCAVTGRPKEAAEEHHKAVEAYTTNPTEYRKNEIDRAKQKLDKSYEELKELKESSFFEYFNSIYNNYSEYLDTLTPDKIVCVFNIIVGGLIFSSFFTILSIMLSENIINRIKFLDRFPRILALLKTRNLINKKIAKFYLVLHLLLILWGILCNIYMFFL
jgi:hypothetical protein